MNARILRLIFVLHVSLVYSQKESANWYFGQFAGLDFNSGNPSPLLNGKLNTSEGCATISDVNGNLLFYTDGITVWDRRHEVMPNGQGLLGHGSSTESALIVPKPGSNSRYYIFTVDKPSYYLTEGESIDGVNYSEIDLSLNNNFGDVITSVKNRHLITYDSGNTLQKEYKSSEKITAVSHKDGSSYWVITQFWDKFYSFKIDVNGVDETPVTSKVPLTVAPLFNDSGVNISAIGYLKVSPNGKKIAIAHSSTILGKGGPKQPKKQSGKVLLYDFDNASGTVSNQVTILSDAYPYGLEFSPNSKLLYVTDNFYNENNVFINSHLFQYNLEANDIATSKVEISTSTNVAGALQLAMNGKIYRAGFRISNAGSSISVIKDPNNLGTSCNYYENTVSLGGKASLLGLPPFVQSIFIYTFDYEFTCLGDQTSFFITSEEPYDSVVWNFGDGHTSSDESPSHIYTSPSTYSVSLTMSLNGIESDPLIKQVIISEPPNVINGIYELVQCDSYDNNPNDGIATYNLQLANAPISLNTSEAIQVYYYHSISDAVKDTQNVNALNNIYRNQIQNELLYAKVYKTNTECFNMSTIRLKTTQPIDIGIHELLACDFDNVNMANFDLKAEGNKIATQLNLPSNVSITFYDNKNDAAIGVNAVPSIYSSGPQTLFIRAESDNACYGDGILNLNVKPFPQLSDQVISVCQDDFPVTINSGISNAQVNFYRYSWNTGETTNEILVNQPGVYSVTVYDETSICEDVITIDVKQNEIPDIQDIAINGQSIQVLINSEETFLFALDDVNGPYQESNVFLNINEGLHQVYIKDVNGCETVFRNFYIFGFPRYFTPNNDGNNDTWNVYGLDPIQFGSKPVSIEIFDRYGKLLKTFDPLMSSGWNGTYQGRVMTPDDYWYFMKLPNGEVYRGHFTLKI